MNPDPEPPIPTEPTWPGHPDHHVTVARTAWESRQAARPTAGSRVDFGASAYLAIADELTCFHANRGECVRAAAEAGDPYGCTTLDELDTDEAESWAREHDMPWPPPDMDRAIDLVLGR